VLEASPLGSLKATVTSLAALKRWVRAPAAAGTARMTTAVRMAVVVKGRVESTARRSTAAQHF
jgi:hypothetical protein